MRQRLQRHNQATNGLERKSEHNILEFLIFIYNLHTMLVRSLIIGTANRCEMTVSIHDGRRLSQCGPISKNDDLTFGLSSNNFKAEGIMQQTNDFRVSYKAREVGADRGIVSR